MRCKMTLVKKSEGPGPRSLEFQPVYSGSEENQSFFAATPGGSIALYVVNEAAVQSMEQGKAYYVDFSEASQ